MLHSIYRMSVIVTQEYRGEIKAPYMAGDPVLDYSTEYYGTLQRGKLRLHSITPMLRLLQHYRALCSSPELAPRLLMLPD